MNLQPINWNKSKESKSIMSKVTANLIRRRLWKQNRAYGEGCYTTSKGKIRDLVAAVY